MHTRSLYLLAAAAGVALFALAAPQPTSGQSAPVDDVSPQLAALITEVSQQSKQLTENQAQIDAKLDRIAELVHQARLFAARSGGKGGLVK